LNGDAATTDKNLFDKAYESEDIRLLIKLVSSEVIVKQSVALHHWAQSPKSIGCCALIKLGLCLRSDQREHVELFISAGGLEMLIAELSSIETDRVHAAILTLYQLLTERTKDDYDLLVKITEKINDMEIILTLNDCQRRLNGTRICSSFILTCIASIYRIIGRDAKKDFIWRCDGKDKFLDHLLNSHNEKEAFHIQLDAMYAIEDLLIEYDVNPDARVVFDSELLKDLTTYRNGKKDVRLYYALYDMKERFEEVAKTTIDNSPELMEAYMDQCNFLMKVLEDS